MDTTVNIVLLWILFAGSHVGLATRRPRTALVAKLGEWGFIGVFSLVAITTYALLIHYFAMHRFDGPAGLGLATLPTLRWLLYAVAGLGAAVFGMALFDYPVSTYAITAKSTHYQARGISRISRHGFFAGFFLIGVAHALLATHMATTAFFACIAVFTLLGAIHQDAKLTAERGQAHQRFVETTSFLPFVAIIAGRQRLVLGEIALPAWVAGLATAWLLATAHDSIFAGEGAYLITATVLGAAVATLQAWRKQRRRGEIAAVATRSSS